MNSDTNNVNQVNRASSAAVGFIAAFLIFIGLAVVVKFCIVVPAVDADRDTVRAKELAEIRTNETALLNHAGWVDQQRGIVRLPIEDAMQIAVQDWKNPAQARSDLLSRQENASKPAPAAPAKPNPFE